MMAHPRVTFGVIVLNGEPFVRYNLRALYPFAHQIIVVEGAVHGAASVATPEGHSRDNTLETLHYFKAHEDPEDKVQIVTKEGFWQEKDEMSQAYAQRATGDYLWQVDIDEFYHPGDMQAVLDMLIDDPTITAVSFQQIAFWGGFDTVVDGWYLRLGGQTFHRLFKWGQSYKYLTHRPPTVQDSNKRNMRSLHWLSSKMMSSKGIFLHHYGLVFPKQVTDKTRYYASAPWAYHANRSQEWATETFMQLRQPYRVHNVYRYPSWLRRFRGNHPPQVQKLREDIATGKVEVEMRPTADIDKLLDSPSYQLGRVCLETVSPLIRVLVKGWRRVNSSRPCPRLDL
jgi:hypothetical protein